METKYQAMGVQFTAICSRCSDSVDSQNNGIHALTRTEFVQSIEHDNGWRYRKQGWVCGVCRDDEQRQRTKVKKRSGQ